MKILKAHSIFSFHALLSCIVISITPAPNASAQNSPQIAQEPLLASHRNISGNDFFTLYMSKDPLKRQLAEMYLNGVLDTTEGKTWCSYQIASPDAIQEQTYLAFKKASKVLLEKRASEIINDTFSKTLPCRTAK